MATTVPEEPMNGTVLALVFLVVMGAVAAWAYPIATADPPQGAVIARATVEDLAPGQSTRFPFEVTEPWARISLVYDITAAAHLRAAFIGPDGERYGSRAVAGELVLEAHDPARGTWTVELAARNEPGLHGFLDSGEFVVLGFERPT